MMPFLQMTPIVHLVFKKRKVLFSLPISDPEGSRIPTEISSHASGGPHVANNSLRRGWGASGPHRLRQAHEITGSGPAEETVGRAQKSTNLNC